MKKAAALFLLVAASCSASTDPGLPEGTPKEGSAFEIQDETMYFDARLAPDDRFISMVINLVNATDDPVTLLAVEPRWAKGQDTVAVIERISAGSRQGSFLPPLGSYSTDPPVHHENGRCNRQELVPLPGTVVQPKAAVAVAYLIRVTGKGSFEIPTHLVRYETEGDVFEQSVPTGVGGKATDQHSRKMRKAERKCAKTSMPL